MRLFSLLAVALILGVALVACNSIDLTRQKNAAATPTPATQPSDGARRITTVELRDALAKGEAVVYDVRSEMAYKEGHIKGAHLLPINEVLTRASELPRDKLIVTYCS